MSKVADKTMIEFSGLQLKELREKSLRDQKGFANLLRQNGIKDVVYYDENGRVHFKHIYQRTISYIEAVNRGKIEKDYITAINIILQSNE
jgi:hypothetical protein